MRIFGWVIMNSYIYDVEILKWKEKIKVANGFMDAFHKETLVLKEEIKQLKGQQNENTRN